MKNLLEALRKIPDFPKPGILFYDVTSWLSNSAAMTELEQRSLQSLPVGVDAIVAIDARGFIVATMLSRVLHVPMYLARKPGKLPVPTDVVEYQLEYGMDKLCLETGALQPGSRVLICDDLLATGGTLKAACQLVKAYNPKSIITFVWLELEDLGGRQVLENEGAEVISLARIA